MFVGVLLLNVKPVQTMLLPEILVEEQGSAFLVASLVEAILYTLNCW
jgi:hypothetical protein